MPESTLVFHPDAAHSVLLQKRVQHSSCEVLTGLNSEATFPVNFTLQNLSGRCLQLVRQNNIDALISTILTSATTSPKYLHFYFLHFICTVMHQLHESLNSV